MIVVSSTVKKVGKWESKEKEDNLKSQEFTAISSWSSPVLYGSSTRGKVYCHAEEAQLREDAGVSIH